MINYVGTNDDNVFFDSADDDVYFGLGGDDTMYQLYSNVVLAGGRGNDEYNFGSSGSLFILENGNDPADSFYESISSQLGGLSIYTIDNRHLAIEDSFGQGVVFIDWERPENRIETWHLDTGTFSYDQFRSQVFSSPSFLGNFSLEQLGYPPAAAALLRARIDELYAQQAALEAGDFTFPATLLGTDAGETLVGGSEDDEFVAEGGDDTLTGGAGNDTLDGGKGADIMSGGPGDDIYIVDEEGDVVNEVDGEGNDFVISSVSFDASDTSIEAIALRSVNNINAIGNESQNIFFGGFGANVLIGRGGRDVFIVEGFNSNDIHVGGTGQDIYIIEQSFWDTIQDGNNVSFIDFTDHTESELEYRVDGLDLIITAPFADDLTIKGYYEDPSQYVFRDETDNLINVRSPDDSLLYSRYVLPSSDIDGSINGSSDPSDFFQFKPIADGVVTVSVSGLSAGLTMFIYDSEGTVFQAGDASASSDGRLDFNVTGNETYYVELRTSGSQTTDYDLSVEADYGGGNTLATAIDIGSETRIDFATVGQSGDNYDYYLYTASRDGDVNIVLGQLESNIDLIIYDENGVKIESSTNGGTDTDSLTLSVTAGEQFFIGVIPDGNVASNYSLLVDSDEVGELGGDAGATLLLASQVPTDFSLTQTVGFGSDNDDLFAVTPETDGTLSIALSDLEDDLTLHMYDSDGARIVRSQTAGLNDETLQLDLTGGETYYIGVTPATGGQETAYSLTVNFEDTGPEPGSTFDTALEIDPGAGVETSGRVGFGSDSDDLFVFTASQSGNVTMGLSGLSADIDLHVYNPNGTRIASSRNSGTQNESLTLQVQSGQQYYVGVTPNTSQGSDYDLSMSYSSSAQSASLMAPDTPPLVGDI